MALLSGALTQVDMRGRVIDDYTGEGIVATLGSGSKTTKSAADGSFAIADLSRFAEVQVDAPGYQRQKVAPTTSEIRMHPLALTLYIREQGTQDKWIPGAEIRLGGQRLAVANQSGNKVISPYPGPNKSLTVCAAGYEPKTFPARGVLLFVDLVPGPTGCPPLSGP